MSGVEQPAPLVAGGALSRVERRRRRPLVVGAEWWRHVVAILAILFALFPVVYVVGAAFNPNQTLGAAQLIPDGATLDNFRELLQGPPKEQADERQKARYTRWYANSMIVAAATAVFNVLLGALAAYAFSRFRFRGRRMGMMALLLVQMFPSFLALVAIYLILLQTGEVFPRIGLNTLTGLVLVHMGGALGINAWLMKGFFDTIPAELDESARVDGATPSQIFWGIVMPLAAPVLAVVAIITFVFTLNEFVLPAALLQTTETFTLPVGLRGYIDQQYAQNWGPFAAGVLLAAVPVAILVMLFQRFFVSGLTTGAVKG